MVIVVTPPSTDDDYKRIVADSGCNNYITKPLIPRLFANAIGRYIHIRTIDWID